MLKQIFSEFIKNYISLDQFTTSYIKLAIKWNMAVIGVSSVGRGRV